MLKGTYKMQSVMSLVNTGFEITPNVPSSYTK